MLKLQTRYSRRLLLAMLCIVTSVAASCLEGCARAADTETPQETAVPGMVRASMAVLGGSQAAFTHEFGQPDLQYIYTFTAKNGVSVVMGLGTLHNFASGEIRVSTVILQPADNKMWDTSTASMLYEAFFPPDARFERDVAGNNGTHHLYMSALLANTFPPQAFVDAAGKRLSPGTFDVVCNNKIMPSVGDANGCGLRVGEWPLQ